MTDADQHEPGPQAQTPTRAQVWAQHAYELITARGAAGLAEVLADDFEQDSRRGPGIRLDSRRLLDTVTAMRELGMRVAGSPVAVAGECCLLTRRHYTQMGREVELLAVSVWTEDGHLARLIEFDADHLDEALSALGEVSGETIVRLDEPA
jgi:hypothetical protein